MKYRNHILYFLVPAIQILFFIVGYDLVNYFAHKMGRVYSRGVAWGISIEIYMMEYIAIIILSGALNYFFPRKRWLVAVVSSIVFSSFIIPVLGTYPYRGAVVILIGAAGIFSGYCFLPKYNSPQPPSDTIKE